MNFEQVPEFQKDLKALVKRWRSLPLDIKDAQLQITELYRAGEDANELRNLFFNGKRATILQKGDTYEVIKMRLDVESLHSNNKVRIVFVALVEDGLIKFIELYTKNEKAREDQKRINKYLDR